METRMCMTVHNPPKSYGDCIRACVATLADDDQVPHVFSNEKTSEESWVELRAFLKSKGRALWVWSTKDHEKEMKENNPDMAYMLICGTETGNHAVICKNGKVVHNPAYYRSEITGPPEPLDEYMIAVVGILT